MNMKEVLKELELMMDIAPENPTPYERGLYDGYLNSKNIIDKYIEPCATSSEGGWVNRGDKSLSEWLPKDGEEYLFDGVEIQPMWARVKWNGKHPCLAVLDSSGEEEYEDAEGYNRYYDKKATSSENYWKQRCEAAEYFVYAMGEFLTFKTMKSKEFEKAFNEWQKLKNE